jgi:capsular polysaccharide biosynthesis protein
LNWNARNSKFNIQYSKLRMQLDLRQILNGLRKRWWLALLVMLSAGAVAYLYEDAKPRVYQVTTMLTARPVPLDNGTIEAIKKTMPAYAQELGSKELLRYVVDDTLIHDVDIDAIAGQIQVQPNAGQDSLIMTVDSGNPETAAIVADSLTRTFVERQAAEAQSVTTGGNRVVWVITQPAEVPTQPYQPRPRLYAAAAALFGLILGLLLAIGLELLDTSLKTPADVKQYTELNTLGAIPKAK